MLISVIVPVYKVESYLDKCVKSLLEQTYQDIEILLIDDGSPDNCPKLCDEYAVKYDKVKCFHKENGGLSSARNYGVERANGNLIAFVDSDDYVEKTYIEDMFRLKEKFNADFVITRTSRENEDGSGKAQIADFEPFLVDKKEALFYVYSQTKVGWAAYGKLYTKEVLLKFPFPDGYFEDCACMYNIIHEYERIVIANYGNNYHYIQRNGSILNSKLNKKHMHIFEICNEFEKYINENYSDMNILKVSMYRSALVQLLNLQSMTWNTYKNLFIKYRPIFRKNIISVTFDKRITFKDKIYYWLLSSWPELFKLQYKIVKHIK